MDIESIVYHPFCDVRLGIYFEVCRLCHVILFRNIYAAIMPWDLYQIAAVTPSPPPNLLVSLPAQRFFGDGDLQTYNIQMQVRIRYGVRYDR